MNLKLFAATSFIAITLAGGPAYADLTLEEKTAADRAIELAGAGYTEDRCQKRFALMVAFSGAVEKGDKVKIAETGRAFDAFDAKDESEATAVKAAFDNDFKDDAAAVIAHIQEVIATEHPCDK